MAWSISVGGAAISARSPQGRYSASENLWVEMKDDHADQFAWAVEHERAFYPGAQDDIQQATDETIAFLKTIFT